MALADDIAALPISITEGNPGHVAHSEVVHQAVQAHQARLGAAEGELATKLDQTEVDARVSAVGDAVYVRVPAGGVDGQALVKSGADFVWADVVLAATDGPLALASPAYRGTALDAGLARLRIAVLGDSSLDGYGNPGGPDEWAKVAPLVLAELLRVNYQVAAGGRGWIPPSTPLAPGNYVWSPATLSPAGFALDDLSTQVGVPGALWLQRGHATNVDEVTWALSPGTTAVDVVTTMYGGDVTITPGSGSPVTLNQTGDRVITRITNPGATINIHGEAGVGFAILGIIEYVGDESTGVTMWNLARGAMHMHEYAAWMSDANLSLTPMITAYDPHVALVCLGANDYESEVAATPNFSDAMTSVYNSLANAAPGVTIVFVIRDLPDNPSGPTWDEYVDTITSTAVTLGAHVLDLRLTIPNGAPGLYLGDGVHYTEAGNLAVAEAVADYMRVAT